MASLRPGSRLLSHRLAQSTVIGARAQAQIAALTPSSLRATKNYHASTTTCLSRTPKSHFHTSLPTRRDDSSQSASKDDPPLPSGISPSKIYSFEDVKKFSSYPEPHRILVDVREPGELLKTGRIPTAVNLPIQSAPDSFFLSPEDFEDKYGFPRPTEQDEVIFYCKAGVRSRAAARLAGQAGFGGKFGEFPGSWVEWEEKGGEVQKE